MTSFKYGKLAAQKPKGFEDFHLDAVLAKPLPKAPAVFGYGKLFPDWGMLGNDEYGDCAWAGSAHETEVATYLGGHAAEFTTANVLSDYGSTGFDPVTGANDNGTNIVNLMDYRRLTGLIDSKGQRHKITLGVRLPQKRGVQVGGFDWDQFQSAVFTFGFVGVGILVPSSAEKQFAAGQAWDYVGDQNIVGGHYIPAVGSTASASETTIITWAKRQPMTKSFFENYVDELWVPLSAEVVKAGYGLHHLQWSAVEALAQSL